MHMHMHMHSLPCGVAGSLAQVVALAVSIVLPLWYANYPGTDRSGKNLFRVATACSSPTKANGGFTVIAFIVIFGFTLVFYSMLFADATGDSPPCSLPMGSCTTISCVCGNYYAEGYVFMFVVLGLVGYTFFTEFAPKIYPKKHVQPEDRRYHRHYFCRFWSKQLVSFGILCVVLTGNPNPKTLTLALTLTLTLTLTLALTPTPTGHRMTLTVRLQGCFLMWSSPITTICRGSWRVPLSPCTCSDWPEAPFL